MALASQSSRHKIAASLYNGDLANELLTEVKPADGTVSLYFFTVLQKVSIPHPHIIANGSTEEQQDVLQRVSAAICFGY